MEEQPNNGEHESTSLLSGNAMQRELQFRK
jgi:hypothetical protein